VYAARRLLKQDAMLEPDNMFVIDLGSTMIRYIIILTPF
jgi:hypothetical protein